MKTVGSLGVVDLAKILADSLADVLIDEAKYRAMYTAATALLNHQAGYFELPRDHMAQTSLVLAIYFACLKGDIEPLAIPAETGQMMKAAGERTREVLERAKRGECYGKKPK